MLQADQHTSAYFHNREWLFIEECMAVVFTDLFDHIEGHNKIDNEDDVKVYLDSFSLYNGMLIEHLTKHNPQVSFRDLRDIYHSNREKSPYEILENLQVLRRSHQAMLAESVDKSVPDQYTHLVEFAAMVDENFSMCQQLLLHAASAGSGKDDTLQDDGYLSC